MNVLQAALERVRQAQAAYRLCGGEGRWQELHAAIEDVRRVQAGGPPYARSDA